MRNKRGWPAMMGGLLLIAAALCLTAYNIWDEGHAAAAADSAVRQLDAEIREAEEAAPPEALPDYVAAPEMEMPTVEIDGHTYIGRLSIPALELSLPVMSDWSYSDLKFSPCRYSGSVYQDDMVIAAHNYTRHFGRLRRLKPGSEVVFTDVDGNQFSYAVTELEQLGPADVEEMVTGDWDLTLFTCTLGGRSRITVRCERQAAAG